MSYPKVEAAFQILERLIELDEEGKRVWHTELYIFKAAERNPEQTKILASLYKTSLVNRLVVQPETAYCITETGKKLYEELTS